MMGPHAFLEGYFRPSMYSWRAFLLLPLGAPLGSLAQQGDVRDTSIFMVPISATYAYQVPKGDLAERFGPNHNIGLSVAAKLKSQNLFGLEGSFIFGDRVNEPSLLSGVENEYGQILDVEGQPASVLVYERGYTIMAWYGRLIPVVGPNPNSGLLLKLGGGYMRHKIRIETQENVVPQLEGDYLTGYDRLTGGPAAMLFVGYQHIGNKRLINFIFGFEMILGFTEPLRAYNFDTARYEEGGRRDGLNGFRLGWTLPIYKRRADGYYFR